MFKSQGRPIPVLIVTSCLTGTCPQWRRIGLVFAVLTGLSATPQLTAQETRPKAFGVRQTTPQLFEAVQDAAPSGNAGLFVGVNEFSDADVAPLQFAVHDAVEQAWLFVAELKLIPATNCVLALAGEPQAEVIKQHLAELQRRGVKVVEPDKTALLDELLAVCQASARAGGRSNLLVVSFSSHGFEDRGMAFLMPHDGRKRRLLDTGLMLTSVEDEMRDSTAGHRLLLVDACQERVLTGDKRTVGGPQAVAMSKNFQQALQQPTGQAKLSSCSVGEFSYEHAKLGGVGHGVFTYAFLEALRGGAEVDDQNLVRLGKVAEYVTLYVKAWVEEENKALPAARQRPPQSPAIYGEISTQRLPLAEKASDLATLQTSLKRRISVTGFTRPLHDRLLERFENYDPASSADRELLTATREFAEGRLQERFFLPYLAQELSLTTPGPTVPRPTAPLPAPIPAPTPQPGREKVSAGSKAGEVRTIGGVKFCWCPPGKFTMGSPAGEKDRQEYENQVNVTLTKGYWLGQYEVTQAEWEKLTGTSLGQQRDKVKDEKLASFPENGGSHPMYYITWDEAVDFCKKLTAQEREAGRLPGDWEYTLPTEAQWEYACRAGTTTATAFGDQLDSTQANFNGNYPYNGAAKGERKEQPVAAGCYRPNPWSLYDMHGNVYEWCRDRFSDELPGGVDPEVQGSTWARVYRGGAWFESGFSCRSAARGGHRPDFRADWVGFRLALVQTR